MEGSKKHSKNVPDTKFLLKKKSSELTNKYSK